MRNGRLLVALQFVLLVAIVVPWGATLRHPWPAAVLLAGAALVGVWTIAVNSPTNFSVFPEPREGARLVTRGPYRLVRHPMYVAVLLLALAFAAGYASVLHAAGVLALAVVLDAKARLEEALLAARDPTYAAYAARTPRWLPFIGPRARR